MPLALKFKSISSEQCEPEQNERSEAECWQKKNYWPKGVKLLKLKYTCKD